MERITPAQKANIDARPAPREHSRGACVGACFACLRASQEEQTDCASAMQCKKGNGVAKGTRAPRIETENSTSESGSPFATKASDSLRRFATAWQAATHCSGVVVV